MTPEEDANPGSATTPEPTSEADVREPDDPAAESQPGEQREPFPPVSARSMDDRKDRSTRS